MSWLALALLLTGIGAFEALTQQGLLLLAGLLAVGIGLLLILRVMLVVAWVDQDGLKARNVFLSHALPWADVREVASGVTETPMTRAAGWRVLVVRRSNKLIRLAATTGANPDSVDALLAAVRSFAPHVVVSANAEDFPTLADGQQDRPPA